MFCEAGAARMADAAGYVFAAGRQNPRCWSHAVQTGSARPSAGTSQRGRHNRCVAAQLSQTTLSWHATLQLAHGASERSGKIPPKRHSPVFNLRNMSFKVFLRRHHQLERRHFRVNNGIDPWLFPGFQINCASDFSLPALLAVFENFGMRCANQLEDAYFQKG